MSQVFICRYNYRIVNDERECQWLLTTDETLASRTDQSYRLATLDDLHDWVCATGEVFNGIVTTANGSCKWFETYYLDDFGEEEYLCEYRLLTLS